MSSRVDFRFSSPLRNGGAKRIAGLPENCRYLGFLPLFYFRGHFRGSRIAKLPLQPEPRHVAKFQKCRFSDVEKSGDRKNYTKKPLRNIMIFALARAGDHKNGGYERIK